MLPLLLSNLVTPLNDTPDSDGIDPRLVKFNGNLLVGRPLAWSYPRSGEELDAQYDAVMEAYRDVQQDLSFLCCLIDAIVIV